MLDVRQETISYSRYIAYQRKVKRLELECKLRAAHKKLAMINLSAANAVQIIQNINTKIDNITQEINQEDLYIAQGAILRSKVRWMEQGEHSSKYFFNLEKQNAKAKVMNQIIDKDGKLEIKQNQILKIQKDFYRRLYTSNGKSNHNIPIPPENVLTREQQLELEKPIDMNEIKNAIKSMALGKTPGADGFQVNFFVVFFQRIKKFLFEAYQFALNEGCLHQTARMGIISLILKKDRDLKHLKNWRPIVLLLTEYKILSKVIANRMKSVLKSLIHQDQTGFMKNRQISDNLRKLLDAMDIAEQKQIPLVLISVDFLKAFDMVEYNAIYKVMEWYNFGPKMINYVRVLFTSFRLTTINNG